MYFKKMNNFEFQKITKDISKTKIKNKCIQKNKKNNDATEVRTQANRVAIQQSTTDLLTPCLLES
jgi:hypothetical protein